jgi:predicted NBD/HSP70 family sugar kinase
MRCQPALEPALIPAYLWRKSYHNLVAQSGAARPVVLALCRPDGTCFEHRCELLPLGHERERLSGIYLERLLKFLLWQKGGNRVLIAGAPKIAAELAQIYSPTGARAFDQEFMGETMSGEPFTLEACSFERLPEPREPSYPKTGDGRGCRVGIDLGGSNRKSAAIMDGRVLYTEEIAWNPYFEKDPAYHIRALEESVARAAAHLPRVDAIGVSAAGVYLNNEVRVASLFRGVSRRDFQAHIRRIFLELRRKWGGVPLVVMNDGEVAAMSGAMALGAKAFLGISMGTSQAAGYVSPEGGLTSWLNELAFAPVDYRENAPLDEWSGDRGCGVQYFSQQAVDRLAPLAGFVFAHGQPLQERLALVRSALEAGDERAMAVYATIGTHLGYALAHYSEFYELRDVLLTGGICAGRAGALIVREARTVLEAEIPALSSRLKIHLPGEAEKLHGQAIAAAFLPELEA